MKICLLNLGCKVNQYEIDGMYGKLKDDYEVTTNLEFADSRTILCQKATIFLVLKN